MKVRDRRAGARPRHSFVFTAALGVGLAACAGSPSEVGASASRVDDNPQTTTLAAHNDPGAQGPGSTDSYRIEPGLGMSPEFARAWHGVEAPLRATGRLFAVCPAREVTVATARQGVWVLARVTLEGRVGTETTHNPAGGLMSAGADVTRAAARLVVRQLAQRETRLAQGSTVDASWIARVVEFDHSHAPVGERAHPSDDALQALSQSAASSEFIAVLLPTPGGTGFTLEGLHQVSDGRLLRAGLGLEAGTPVTELFAALEQGGAQ